MADYAHILLAIDFTPATDRVANRALELCRACNARLSLVHVVEFTPMDLSSDLVLPQDTEVEKVLLDHAHARLQEMAEKLGVGRSDTFVR